jgi:hypothetical protein
MAFSSAGSNGSTPRATAVTTRLLKPSNRKARCRVVRCEGASPSLRLADVEALHGGFHPGDEAGVQEGRGGERERVLAVLFSRQQPGEDIDRAEADQALHHLHGR